MVSTAGPSRTSRPRRSSASTANGSTVSSIEVAEGSRTGISISVIVTYMALGRTKCEPDPSAPISQTPDQYRLLSVQAVLGLIEYDRMGAVDHLVRHLVSAMGGKTVHEQGIRLGAHEKLRVDLITPEQVVPARTVPVTHRDPGVGNDAVGILDGFFRVGADDNVGLCAPDPFPEPSLRPQLGRARHLQAEFETLRGVHPGRQHVVGVAGPGDFAAADRAAMLLEGHDIREDLAGMRTPRQSIDHRHGCV